MKPSESKDFYERLGVARDAPQKAIRLAFHKLAKRYHPDSSGYKDERDFKAINEAYETLSDKKKRNNYDNFRFDDKLDNGDIISVPDIELVIQKRGHTYKIKYAPEFTGNYYLFAGSRNYYETRKYSQGLKGMPSGSRLSTALEELVIQDKKKKEGIDPKNSEYKSLFETMSRGHYTLLWTANSLATPKGWLGRKDKNNKYPRILKEFEKEIELVYMPEGFYVSGKNGSQLNKRLIVEFNAFGMPEETREIESDSIYSNYLLFDPYMEEVAIAFGVGSTKLNYCINFSAHNKRSSNINGWFRAVLDMEDPKILQFLL